MSRYKIRYRDGLQGESWLEANYWTLDGEGWFDFYASREGDDDYIVMTVASSEVLSVIREELEPTD